MEVVMEPKFVNKCVQTEQHLREMQFAAMGKVRLFIYTFTIILVAITSAMMLKSGVYDSAFVLIMMGIIMILIAYVHPLLAARQQIKRNAILTADKENTPTELSFFDDRVVTVNPTIDKEISFYYTQFKKLKTTKHLYLLALPQRLYLLIDRNGFTVGTAKEFEEFIKSKIKK